MGRKLYCVIRYAFITEENNWVFKKSQIFGKPLWQDREAIAADSIKLQFLATGKDDKEAAS